ncbi:hypothetical protein H696_01825 [Fonticula alba]|uniref:Actin-binding transcription modulator n=1 Tax=Fonticula alba TaxID=691883 RepID=A0A058ZBS2_FONAL|nr:hypothetical protein H696_01825 [Fonticula alba]KCV70877.1 hypothetical protein H696_01825 [Fonticula alba]|eukprot:XP_009494000.1 hypothetical protein H696_01825 [Fonticula alba]
MSEDLQSLRRTVALASEAPTSDAEVAEFEAEYQPFLARYGKSYYIDDRFKTDQSHGAVFHHVNGLLILGLAPGHSVLRTGQTVTKVSFPANICQSIDKRACKGRPRGPPRGQKIHARSTLATFEARPAASAEGAPTEPITSSINLGLSGAQLIELNRNLATNPSLVSTAPESEGFLAIAKPSNHQRGPIVQKFPFNPWCVSPERYAGALEASLQEQEQLLKKAAGEAEAEAVHPPAVAPPVGAESAATEPV